MQAHVFDITGKSKGEIALAAELFEVAVNKPLLAQAVRIYLANQRQGNANTKSRGEVTGSTRKIFRQKGTGNARHGDIKAPIFVGGGIVHGPVAHSFTLQFPKKMKRAAVVSALSSQADKVVVVEGMNDVDGTTKAVTPVIKAIRKAEEKLLVVLTGEMKNASRSLRNLEKVTYMNVADLNAYTILTHPTLVFTKEALGELEKKYNVSATVGETKEAKKTKKVKKEEV